MENWPINPTDAFVLGAVLLSGILALLRGLVREILSLASWSAALAAGVKYAPNAKAWGLKVTSNETVALGIGGFIIFILVLIILTVASHYIAKLVRESALSTVDRSLGFAFGAARGFLVAVLVYLGCTMLFSGDDKPAWMTGAQTEPALRTSANWVKGLLPEDIKKDLDKAVGLGEKAATEDKQDVLEKLSTPQPEGAAAPAEKPLLDDKTKHQLQELIIKQVAPAPTPAPAPHE